MFKKLFGRNKDLSWHQKELEKARHRLVDTLDESMKAIENDINTTRETFEKMRNHGLRRFDHLLNISIQVSISQADMMLLSEKIRLSARRLDKLLFARMLAMIVIEYLKDINTYLGHNLITELTSNNYKDLIPRIKEVNKKFADIRKQHEKLLTKVRNNISAHKNKDALELVHYIFNLDPDQIAKLTLEVITTSTELNQVITKVYWKMVEELENKKRRI